MHGPNHTCTPDSSAGTTHTRRIPLSEPGYDSSPQYLETHYLLRPLHSDPRFQALIDRERDRVF